MGVTLLWAPWCGGCGFRFWGVTFGHVWVSEADHVKAVMSGACYGPEVCFHLG